MSIIKATLQLCSKAEYERCIPMVRITRQSRPVNNEPNVRCSSLVNPGEFLLNYDKEVKTLYDCIYHGLKISRHEDCLGARDPYTDIYEWFTYHQIVCRMKYFGSGLVHLGAKASNQTKVCIYGVNSIEWVVAEFACYHYSMVVVPLYDTLGSVPCQLVVSQTNSVCVIVDRNDKIERLLKLSDKLDALKFIILMNDNLHQETALLAREKSIKLYTFDEVEKIGESNFVSVKPPRHDQLAVINYTSGTTGRPKGAMLTHYNLVAAASAVMTQLDPFFDFKNETMISYLPLSNSFERIAQIIMLFSGGRIGMYSGDVKRLPNDLQSLKPTVMPCVPRIINRIYNKVISKVKGNRMTSRLLDIALKSKQSEIEKYIIKSDGFWDALIFKQIRQILGGNLKLIMSGTAPISPTVLSFMRCAFGCVVIEGYGQTESSSPTTLTHCGDFSTGHVGPPISSNIVKLIDCPDMNFFVNETGIGEVCVKGTNVFIGYYGEEESTREVIDEEGWLHTGDIGQWQENGTLKILDRKRYIFKIKQGEYIAPEKIENIYQQSSYVSQCFVTGDSLRSYLVGIIVPDEDRINIWCNESSMISSVKEACRNALFKKSVLNNILDIGIREGLQPFEQVKDIFLQPRPFSISNGLLTPTMKIKRRECQMFFRDQIEEMYRNIERMNNNN